MQKRFLSFMFLLCAGILLACNGQSSPQVYTEVVIPTLSPLPSMMVSPSNTVEPVSSATPTRTPTPFRTPTITRPAPISYSGPLPTELLGRLGTGYFNQVAVSPDGGHIAIASSVGIYIYGTKTWGEEQMFLTNGNVISVAWSPDGKRIASGIGDKISIWDVKTGTQQQVLSAGVAYKIRWSPDGDLLGVIFLVDRYSTSFSVWNVDNKTLRYSLEENGVLNQDHSSLDMDWSSKGRLAVTNGERTLVMDGATGETLYQLVQSEDFGTPSVAWSPDGDTLAYVTSQAITLLNGDDGSEKQTTTEEINIFPSEVAWSKDGQYLTMSKFEKETYGFGIAIWDIKNSQWVDEFFGHTYPASNIVWLDEDTKIASVQEYGRLLIVWDIKNKTPQYVWQGNRGLKNLAWSLDGKTVSANDGRDIIAWDIDSRQPVLVIGVSSDVCMNYGGVRDMVLSPDGQHYATVRGDDSRVIEIWDALTGVPEDFWIEAEPGLAWSPDGNQIVAGTRYRKAAIWDSKTGSVLHEYDFETSFEYKWGVGWSPDGTTIAGVNQDGKVSLLSFPSADRWLPLENCGEHLINLIWSPDGDKIAAFSYSSGTIYICNPKADRLLARLEGLSQQPEVTDMDWSIDGRFLAATSYRLQFISSRLQTTEHRVIVWDTTTWQPVRTLEGKEPFYSVAFSPDSKTLAIGSSDGTVWLIEP